jgi:hypothetical protein
MALVSIADRVRNRNTAPVREKRAGGGTTGRKNNPVFPAAAEFVNDAKHLAVGFVKRNQ